MSSLPAVFVAGDNPELQRVYELIDRASKGRFAVRQKIGQGGMGGVYSAEDLVLGGYVAIKIPRDDPEFYERFIQVEIQAARALDGVNGTPGIIAADEFSKPPFLAMEYVEGRTLKEVLKANHGRLTEDETRELGARIARILSQAHERGVVHRDLKADNIVIRNEGEVVLLDFGGGALPGLEMTMVGTALGTQVYMAPERLCTVNGTSPMDAARNPAVDTYNLGVLLYVVITGGYPAFHHAHLTIENILEQADYGIHTQNLHKRSGLMGIIGELVRSDPQARPRMSEVAERLGGVPVVYAGTRRSRHLAELPDYGQMGTDGRHRPGPGRQSREFLGITVMLDQPAGEIHELPTRVISQDDPTTLLLDSSGLDTLVFDTSTTVRVVVSSPLEL